jgi:tetratricopeptide (TPR) repeat protein
MQRFFVLLFIVFYQSAFSQIKQPQINGAKSPYSGLNIHLNVYRNALKSGDYNTAIIAMNYVVVNESKTGKYRDSLAYLYYSANSFYQSLYWSNEVLGKEPGNIGLMEVKAASLKQTNQLLPAIEAYESLLKMSPSPVYAFNLTELQYQAKRLYECLGTTQLAEGMNIPKDMVYSYKISEQQDVKTPLLAGFYNYRGLALYELGNKQLAKEAFEKALVIDSGFLLAKSNLLTVSKELLATSQGPVDSLPANGQANEKTLMRKE